MTLTQLEKLDYFSKAHAKMQADHKALQERAQALDKEWDEFVTNDLKVKGSGPVHLADLIKAALEQQVGSNLIKLS